MIFQLKELGTAVVEQAMRDYVNARKYLIENNCPANLKNLRQEALVEYDEARLWGDGQKMHKYRILLDRYEMFMRRLRVVEEISDFFCGQDFSYWSNLDGKKLLKGIENNLVRKIKKGA